MGFIFTPKPFNDENLISYLYRHSSKNDYPVEWIFSQLYFRIPKAKYNIINLSASEIKRIAKVLNLNSDEVDNMIYSKYNIYDSSQILNLKSSRYCPKCLKEESYYRLHWDITPIKICMKHRSFLLETCYNCGNDVSILDIISSKCSCGSDLSGSSYNICKDESIIGQQTDLLNDIGISIRNGNIISNGKSYHGYLYSLYNLINFLRFKRHKLKKINKIFGKYTDFDDEFYIFIVLFKIKTNIDLYLPMLLDDLNPFYPDLDDITEYYYTKRNKICNPLSEITNYLSDFVSYFGQYDYFYNYLDKYFKDNYNYSFFSKALIRYMSEDGYIELLNASDIFNIDSNTLINSMDILENKRYVYVKLQDVIDVIYEFIVKYRIGEMDNNEEYIPFPEVAQLFKNFNIEEKDIISIIIDNKVEGMIDIFNNNIGMNLLKFKKEQLFSVLLQEALKRYN